MHLADIDFTTAVPLAAPPALRRRIEGTIERLIVMLDAIDGDPDSEATGDELEDVEGDYTEGWFKMTHSFAPIGCSPDDEDDDAGEYDHRRYPIAVDASAQFPSGVAL